MKNNFDVEVCKMRSLMERIDRPMTCMQAMLNEDRHINEGVERKVETPDKLFDILDQIGKNSFVCIGYVSAANVDMPKVKRINPETNKMKSYDDYESFGREIGSEDEIGALVKITSYNFRYYGNDEIKKQYNNFIPGFNDIRSEFGLKPVERKENNYTQSIGYGSGVETYAGNDETKQGNFYINANTYGATVKGVVYAVDTQGNIVKELKPEQVKPYLKAKGEEVPGANALRKMGKEEELVQKYIEKVRALKMNYKRFEGNSILWVAATVNGQKIVYVNSNLTKAINGIDINKSDFIKKANERYKVDAQ